MSFEEEHLDRLNACSALEGELFVSGTGKDLGVKKARDLDEVKAEIELRTDFYDRLKNLWGLMISAGETRDEALSKATATRMKVALHTEFHRREGQS